MRHLLLPILLLCLISAAPAAPSRARGASAPESAGASATRGPARTYT